MLISVWIFIPYPSLIEKLRPAVVKSQPNPKLDEQVKTGNTASEPVMF
jgi:hypothetical protein